MFDNFFIPGLRAEDSPLVPSLDIKEDDKYLTVTADLPGVARDDVQISVQDNILTVKGQKNVEREKKGDTYHFVERKHGSFCRTVPLPTQVDSEHAEATMKDGVLTLRMPTTQRGGGTAIKIS